MDEENGTFSAEETKQKKKKKKKTEAAELENPSAAAR